MRAWELWYADFPFEDKPKSKDRPVIIINTNPLCVLSIKVTGQEVRMNDKYDTPIKYWQEAGLSKPSVARISKTMSLSNDKFRRKIGDLHIDDIDTVLKTYLQFLFDTQQINITNEETKEKENDKTDDSHKTPVAINE